MHHFRITCICFGIIAFSSIFQTNGFAEEKLASKQSPTQETEVFQPCPAKLVVMDASPVDPGHLEVAFAYTIKGAGKQWRTNGGRKGRKLYRENVFDTAATFGVFDNVDIGITQGFSILADKENNYDETGGATDPAMGDSLDETDGPHKGHGLSDLIVNTRWRFYQSEDKTFRMAYIPSIVIPTGRRSNLDHLGPSQGYVSMGNALAVTKDIKRWTMSGNAGYEVPLAKKKRTGNSAGTMTFAAGAGYHVFDWLQPQIEMIYSHGFESPGKGSNLFSMVFGAIIPINDHLRLDLGLVQDIAGSNADQTTSGVFKTVFAI